MRVNKTHDLSIDYKKLWRFKLYYSYRLASISIVSIDCIMQLKAC